MLARQSRPLTERTRHLCSNFALELRLENAVHSTLLYTAKSLPDSVKLEEQNRVTNLMAANISQPQIVFMINC